MGKVLSSQDKRVPKIITWWLLTTSGYSFTARVGRTASLNFTNVNHKFHVFSENKYSLFLTKFHSCNSSLIMSNFYLNVKHSNIILFKDGDLESQKAK